MIEIDGQAWDRGAPVRYPNRRAVADMTRDPGNRAVAHLRAEALMAAVLPVLQLTSPIGR